MVSGGRGRCERQLEEELRPEAARHGIAPGEPRVRVRQPVPGLHGQRNLGLRGARPARVLPRGRCAQEERHAPPRQGAARP